MTPHRRRPDSTIHSLGLIRPVFFLLLCYLSGILLFAAFRVAFVFSLRDRLGDAGTGNILLAFLIGWRFDQVVALALLTPLTLVLPLTGLGNAVVRRVAFVYLGIVLSASTILLLADLRFYKYFQTHLNFQAFQYAREGGGTTWHLIRTEPVFLLFIIIWITVTILLALLWPVLGRVTQHWPERRSWTGTIMWWVLCVGITAFGIRGRTGTSPIDWSVAYFSNNHTLNQSALNGIYTLGKALSEEGRDPRLVYFPEAQRFKFVPFQEGIDTVAAMLASPRSAWLEPGKSLKRLTAQPENPWGFKPNVVIVLMESWTAHYTGALGSPLGLTPHFDRLASEGILFTNFYASGTRTIFGLPAVLFSFPSLPGRSVMSRYDARHPFVSISEILHDRGYENLFVYGGDIVFDNMQGFLKTRGFDRLYGDGELGKENGFAKWGIPDHIVFRKAIELAQSVPRPFQMTILTLSNHEPFDLPDSSVQLYHDASDSAKIRNAQAYADFALGSFIDSMSSKSFFDSTIFVFTADHARYGIGRLDTDPIDFHIPLLIYSPKLLQTSGIRMDRVGGQTDVLPTLMGLLGGDYVHESWGQDMFDTTVTASGFAVINSLISSGMIANGLLYSETLGRPPLLYRLHGTDATAVDTTGESASEFAALQRRLRAFLQIADQLSTPQTSDTK